MSVFRGIATGFFGAAIEDKATKDKNKAEVLKGAAKNYYTNTLPQTIEMENNIKNSYDRIATEFGTNAAELADINKIITGDGKGYDNFKDILKNNNLKKEDLEKATFDTDFNKRYETRGKTFNEKYAPIFEQIGIKEIGGMGPYTVKSQLEETTVPPEQPGMETGETQQFSSTKLSDYLIPKPGVLQIPENEFGRVAKSFRDFQNVISFDAQGNVKFAFKGTKDVEYNALRAVTNQVSGNFYNEAQKKVNVGSAVEEANKILTGQTENHIIGVVNNYQVVKQPAPGKAGSTATGSLKITEDDLLDHLAKMGTKSEQRYYALSFPTGVTLPGTNQDVREFLLNITR
jgi:hypothetical protein|tara:strand:- start:323 stop:1357 length:1035 start_codon:yes stop_codon:yes gene_type:complete